MTQLDRIEQIHPDLISQFFATGKCDAIPQELQKFLEQLQWAMEIYEHERSITRAARKLQQRINANQGMGAFNAARMRGIPAELLLFPDENHWVLQPQNALLWQRTFFDWLKETLQ